MYGKMSNLCHKEFFYQKFKQKLTKLNYFPLSTNLLIYQDNLKFEIFQSLFPPVKIHKMALFDKHWFDFQVMQTCKKLGIKTVAVFSEADAHAVRIFIIVIWYSCFIISSIVLFCVVKNRCLK